jgi:hypothetical protein
MLLSCKKIILSIVTTGALVLALGSVSRGEVVVFDDVTTVRTAIRIRVLTKGRIFAQGGRIVDVYLDDHLLKQVLTGGDGYGYLKYIPSSPGMIEINARSGAHSATGRILVMGKREKAIIIDVEGAFKDALFSEARRKNSRKVVRALSKDYRIIYLSRYVGRGVSQSWLTKEDFPQSVILRWQGLATLKTLAQRDVTLHAVIGSDAVISAAKNHIEHRFTFEKSKNGKMVEDWDEILKLLQPAAAGDALRRTHHGKIHSPFIDSHLFVVELRPPG